VYNPAFHDFERRYMVVQLPTLVQMLSRLVAIPSMSGVDPRFDCGNRAVVAFLLSMPADFTALPAALWILFRAWPDADPPAKIPS